MEGSFKPFFEYLAHRYQLLLPEMKCCPLQFLKQIESGEKKALPLKDVREFYLPQVSYVPTKSTDLYNHCIANPKLRQYVPESKPPDRGFLVRLMATLELETLIELNKLIIVKKIKLLSTSNVDDPKIKIKPEDAKPKSEPNYSFKTDKKEEKDEKDEGSGKEEKDEKKEESDVDMNIDEDELENIIDELSDLQEESSEEEDLLTDMALKM